jgi:hypothetical protein
MALKELRIGDQTIEHDRDMTERVYRTLSRGDAEECGCMYCQNFAAQRNAVYPDAFKKLLGELGIDPAKEGEVYELGPTGPDRFAYGGWFYFVGEMVTAGEKNTQSDGFEYWFTAHCPDAPAFRGGPLLAIEFLTALPWVLAVNPE